MYRFHLLDGSVSKAGNNKKQAARRDSLFNPEDRDIGPPKRQ
jgi:hypothetical protein